jgi:7-cyano-7-deazaguanine reductase
MAGVKDSLLGKEARYADRYAPELLFPIARAESRGSLGLNDDETPFVGEDVWTSFEVSWLSESGKPIVALGIFRVPSNSTNIIESKSFKLYLNSFNQEKFRCEELVVETMVKDLSAAANAPVQVELRPLGKGMPVHQPDGECIDDLEPEGYLYEPTASLLSIQSDQHVNETLYSDLLRSNCPVTGQPDWGTVVIQYRGPKIVRESLLRYIVSFRQCQDFHEHCVERMFLDLKRECQCVSLSVVARYTRRGGLDINPYRATEDLSAEAPATRFVRQ